MFENDFEYRENRIKEKLKWLIAIILGIVFIVVVTKLLDSCSHRFVEDVMEEKKAESVTKLSMNNESEAQEVLKGIAIKNGDWSSYPLSDEFLKKYNSKDGIFPQYSFEEVSCGRLKEEYNEKLYKQGLDNILNNEKLKNSSLGGVFSYRIGNGLTKLWENSVRVIIITYYINNKGELDDFIITSDKQTVDEDGNAIIEYNEEYNPNNIFIIGQILFYDKNSNNKTLNLELMNIDKQPISEHLKSKVKYKENDQNRIFIDFFPEIDYTFGELYFGIIKTKEEAFDLKKIHATCQVYGEGKEPYYDEPEKIYLYEVNFQLDNQNKLDDISVKYLREMTYEEYLKQYE